MVLRQRKKALNKVVQELDAFPKVPELYVEQTASGASVSLVTFILVACLLLSEIRYFLNPGYTFRFVPDTDFESKLGINVDMTIATPCDSIGADIVDSTNQNTFKFGSLKEENTWFELDRVQRQHFESIRSFNGYLREEYHAIQDLLWKSAPSYSMYGELPPRRTNPDEPHDACRVYGSLTLNKVAGNFHVSPGKSVPLVRGHAHLTPLFSNENYNFTHRIDKFSFGPPHGGIVQPLEGEEKITDKSMTNYQYFIQVVPTDIQGYSDMLWSTFQYSAKEHSRPVGDGGGGTPGIYFKYDFSALKVIAAQDREPLWKFLVRLCASVGGLVSTSHIICGLIKSAVNYACCRRDKSVSTSSSESSSSFKTADLISPRDRVKD